MPLSSDDLEHPTLNCTLRGTPSASTLQFRNLKYASIPARYQESTPNDELKAGPDGVFDATRFGPSCPQKRGAQALDLLLFLGNVTLPCEEGQGETEKMGEFECLHVNVTVPNSSSEAGKRASSGLPVFVWVHGGGLSIGSNNWPQYDLRKFVERSVEVGKPFIGVAINYRVNAFGLLASDEIESAGNMGFKDQGLAFRWIKKHIAGFGGDPNNMTAAGESAGGISLSTLLCADLGSEGLFNRVVVMSGDTTLRKPRNKWWQQKMYEDQAQILGLQETVTEELKNVLLDTDAEELAQKLPLAQHFSGYVDGEWLPEEVTHAKMADGQHIQHKPTWCAEFVTGDTEHDGLVLKGRVIDRPHALDRLKAACALHLTEAETERLLSAYKLNEELSTEQQQTTLLALTSELRFYLPALKNYEGWKTSSSPKLASRYHFHVPNPFDGALKGLAAHELDVAYLFQHFNDQFDEKDRRIAKGLADRFINFANGEGWVEEGKVVVFGPDEIVEVDEKEYDALYRGGRGRVLESIDADKLWKVADVWQGVRSEDEENR
jgi:carboxylesterase type B